MPDTTCDNRIPGIGPCVLPPDHEGDHADPDGRTWYNRGPLQHYEIVWMSGHVETVPAHQVTYPHRGLFMTAALAGGMPESMGRPRVQIHAEIDGHWLLTLSALEEDIRSMRLVTAGEAIPDVR